MARRNNNSIRYVAGPGKYDKSSWDEWIEDVGVVVRLFNENHDDIPHQRFMRAVPAVALARAAHREGLFQKTQLRNGLRVVTEKIPSVRSVSLGVWVDVGSRDEMHDENGLTHFVEHMVFKGTKRRNARQSQRVWTSTQAPDRQRYFRHQ